MDGLELICIFGSALHYCSGLGTNGVGRPLLGLICSFLNGNGEKLLL